MECWRAQSQNAVRSKLILAHRIASRRYLSSDVPFDSRNRVASFLLRYRSIIMNEAGDLMVAI